MDPPISHVLTNNIQSVEIKEGPFDVENFGTLGGLVDVKIKEPQKEFSGEINLNAGSFDYKKASASVSGGFEKLRFLLSASKETSGQYKDGNGNTLYEQNHKMASSANGNKYQEKHKDIDSYEKKTLLTKLYFDLTDKQRIKLAYTANRSDNILFANTGMDAKKIDSDIYTFNYEALDLAAFSKKFNIDIYNSKVNHPMTSLYRNKAVANGEWISDTDSKIKGIKLKNSIDLFNGEFTFGVDASKREWIYDFYKRGVRTGGWNDPFITENHALFSKYNKDFGKLNFDFGLRYDRTNLKHDDSNYDRNMNDVSMNTFFTYKYDENTSYFFGLGKASRVPDFKEVVWGKNDFDLDKTKNYEIDLGFEKNIGDFSIKTKAFYSILKDYIYKNQVNGGGYENLDAKIYGLEVSGMYLFTDDLYFDYALAYKRGKKDKTTATQEDRDLADITPLRGNLGLTYENLNHKLNASVLFSDKWDKIDSANAEQEIDSYAVLNLKYNNQFHKNFDITLGVDNVFDSTYAVSNTYSDIGIADGFTGEKTMINEPGRYMYVNLRYRF